WASLLPTAQFSHNVRIHSTTGKTPFELLYGFTPRSHLPISPKSKVPSVEKHLTILGKVR
ncbi:hypothetical protein DENSPDRAFT_745421, partial [Dentipellis sp. KUC8613]